MPNTTQLFKRGRQAKWGVGALAHGSAPFPTTIREACVMSYHLRERVLLRRLPCLTLSLSLGTQGWVGQMP